jgi:hypothetical protein
MLKTEPCYIGGMPTQSPLRLRDDVSLYGIVPAWGFATVLESNIEEIKSGSLIYGLWPISSLPVDLKFTPVELPGHWRESSDNRQQLMPLYNRYMVDQRTPGSLLDDQDPETIGLAWDAAARLIWGCGHLLNCFVFPFDGNIKPVPPPSGLPVHFQVPWSKEDADLSSTLFISLSASTKTGLSLTHQLIHNRPKTASPLALLAVASKADPTTLCLDGAPFPTKAVTYVQAAGQDTRSWISSLAPTPSRALITDFGGRGTALSDIHAMLTNLGLPVTTVAVGSEAKVYTPAERAASQAEFKRLGKIQSNGSGQRSGAMAQLGEERYFEEMFQQWREFRENGGFPGMRLKWGAGMLGEGGIEGGWKRLCEGTLTVGNENVVFRL